MDKFLGINKRKVTASDVVSEPPNAKRTKTTKKTSGKIDGKTIEQHRRALGDQVKRAIKVEKWAVEARTAIESKISLAVFRELVVPHADSVVPPKFDATTPVVVASTKQMGEIFGKSKIKGGTRLGSWSADKGDLIFFPSSGELRVWWTMK